MRLNLLPPNTPLFTQASDLLASLGLPVSDLADPHLRLWGLTDDGGDLSGVVGAQIFPDSLLLRSLAVAPDRRGEGLAGILCQHVFDYAAEQSLTDIFLLTQTAPDYFSRLGFSDCPRNTAPKAIQTTAQFSNLCPDDAHFMKLTLKPGRR